MVLLDQWESSVQRVSPAEVAPKDLRVLWVHPVSLVIQDLKDLRESVERWVKLATKVPRAKPETRVAKVQPDQPVQRALLVFVDLRASQVHVDLLDLKDPG